MSHTYVSTLLHCVFSTKNRKPWIKPDIQDRLWRYMGGIARKHRMKALEIGGVDDHCHLLLSLPATMSASKAMQLIKGNSSKFIHDTFVKLHDFEWQEGYGAFSIGVSQIDATRAYIQNQFEHHHKLTFQEEFTAFLVKHHIEFDSLEIWK